MFRILRLVHEKDRGGVSHRRYELVVAGEAASLVSAALPGFEVLERPPTTVIRGEISDPAALEEAIATVLRLGLDLCEVREVGATGRPPRRPDDLL